MSFSLGIYDLFSYILPGGLYLVCLNEIYKLFTSSPLPIDLNNFAHLVIATILSFVLGVVINPISRSIWGLFFRFKKKSSIESVFEEVKSRHPQADIRLRPNQWQYLVAHLRRENIEGAHLIDRSHAYSIMFRNFSAGFIILAITQAIRFFVEGYSVFAGILVIVLIVCAIVSVRESRLFIRMYYSSIFEDAVASQIPVSLLIKPKRATQEKKNKK
jgi:hypothetical protein